MDSVRVNAFTLERSPESLSTGTDQEGNGGKPFSVKLLTRVSTGKGLEIHILRVNNVISFSCICLQCEQGFATQSLLELHMRTHLKSEDILTGPTVTPSVSVITKTADVDCDNITDGEYSSFNNDKRRHDNVNMKSEADDDSIDVTHLSAENRTSSDYPEDVGPRLQTTMDRSLVAISKLTGSSSTGELRTCSENEDDKDVSGSRSEQDSHKLVNIPQRLAKKINPLECNLCGKKLSRMQTLAQHMNWHSGVKPYVCTVCDISFHVKSQLTIHNRKHTETNLHTCDKCGKRFTRLTDLKSHSLVHTGVKVHPCSKCGRRFRLPSQVLEHMKVHTKVKPHMCSFCGKTFSRSCYLKRHEQEHHGDYDLTCGICNKVFRRHEKLKEHHRRHTQEKPHLCPECGKTFHVKYELDQHLKRHAADKPFSCSKCGKKFCQKYYFEEHLRIHTGERPFKCTHCDLTFRMRASVKRHIEKQHEEKVTHTNQDHEDSFVG